MAKNKLVGFTLVILGAFFWGIGGTMSQQLFQKFEVGVGWLVTIRLLIGGILLLLTQSIFKDRKQVFRVWQTDALRLIIFGLVGMLAVQYTYLASINYGNAAVATLLQYLAPVMIIVWLVLTKKFPFTRKDFVTVTLALLGCFFLLTNGSVSAFAVPMPAIVWGLLAGVTLAFYTLYAIPLLKKYDSLVIVGWAMVIGAVAINLVYPVWDVNVSTWTGETIFYLIIVVIFGTMLAFWFYIESLQTLTAKETSLLGNIEPLTAVLATVLWLGEPFGTFQWLGTGLIILMMIYLAVRK
ncbi:EamA family transporter [Lysinibacillus sp. LZ02]|uniref:EamA family transporter n=1 Tax=Lysinibacillus sp. LZ02 TaxID=3420668 RepID=UPI003D36B612